MKNTQKPVALWLMSGCVLIFLMVVIGGVTRLTHSGLSISDYKIITGILPPLSRVQWQEAFDLYKQYPEYQKLNYRFTLEDFKGIYFWEWLHRLIGRLLGVVFIIPFIWFLFKRRLDRRTLKLAVYIGALGAFQGFLGWYMVKSGLVDRPDVSHFRLAAHLTTAFLTFAVTLWAALPLWGTSRGEGRFLSKRICAWIWVAMAVTFLQIIWGAFVAGLDAGLVHNTFPWMAEGYFMHPSVTEELTPTVVNFFEGRSGVQFVHRMGALVVVLSVLMVAVKGFKSPLNAVQRRGLIFLLAMVALQFILGVVTLMLAVPLFWGLAHQIGAFLLLGALVYALYLFSAPSDRFSNVG